MYVELLWGDFDFAQSDKVVNIIFKAFYLWQCVTG